MHNFPLASLLAQQSLHFGPTDGNLPHRIPCNFWHSCALTSLEMPDLCHFIIRRALNVTSSVLITHSENSCHLGTAWKCYTELSSALCKVFWGISLPNDNPRLWNSSGQSSCFRPYFYTDAFLSCREKHCSRCSSVLCIASNKEQSLTNLLRYPVALGHKVCLKGLSEVPIPLRKNLDIFAVLPL